MRQVKMASTLSSRALAIAMLVSALSLAACDRSALSGSKLTLDNYTLITTGMSKGQSQEILGAPTSMETKNMVLFEKTTWRYEDGKEFVILTFKNDQLDSKDSNLGVK
jgi:outer membrane protein assembly factor BamE (lipoprotein component of BamABCDE complex)